MRLNFSKSYFHSLRRLKKPWKKWILYCGKFTETGINYISHLKGEGGGGKYNSLDPVREDGNSIKLPRRKNFQSDPETWVKSWQCEIIVLAWQDTSSSYFCSLYFGNSWECSAWSAKNTASQKFEAPNSPFYMPWEFVWHIKQVSSHHLF